MSQEDSGSSGFDQVFTQNRAIADSPAAQYERLKKEQDGETPVSVPLPQVQVEQPQAHGSSDAAAALQDAASGAVNVAGDIAQSLVSAGTHPIHTMSGVAQMLTNVNNAGLEAFHAIDGWRQGQGFHWSDLKAGEGVDYTSGYPAPVTDSEKSARAVGNFLSGVGAFALGGEVAGAAGALAEAGKGVQVGLKVLSAGGVGFLSFDPHGTNLADLMQRQPGLRNQAAEWFANKSTDSAFDGRFKNFLTTALGEGMGIALLKTLQMYKARSLLSPAADEVSTAVQIPPESPPPGAAAVAEAPKIVPPETVPVAGVDVPDSPNAPVEGAPVAANESALQAAETTPADALAKPLDQAAPDLLASKRGPPVGDILPAERAAGTSQPVYGNLNQEQFNRISQKINLSKIDEAQQANYAGVEGAISKTKVPTLPDEKRFADAIKTITTDKQYVSDLAARGAIDATDAKQVTVSAVLREVHWSEMQDIAEQLKNPNLSAKEVEDLSFRNLEALQNWDKWAGISRNTESVAGQALSAARGAGISDTGLQAHGLLKSNPDLLKFTYGDKESAMIAAKQLATMMGDPKYVKSLADMEKNFPALARTSKIASVVQNFYAEGLISGPKTAFVIKPISHMVNLAKETIGEMYTNAAARKIAQSEAVLTPEVLAKAGLSGAPESEIQGYRSFLNNRLSTEAGARLEAVARANMFKGITEDLIKLNGLASDQQYISHATSKFGNITRTATMEELGNMDLLDRAAILFSQVKSRGIGHVPSQLIGVSDAVLNGAVSRMSSHSVAMRYALANATDEAMVEVLYKDALENPKPWMRQLVVDTMDRTSLTTDITKQSNPLLYRAQDLFKHPVLKPLAPFTTIAINGVSQALEHSPIGASFVSKRFRDAIEAGGLARDQAMGRVMMGQHMVTLGAVLGFSGIYVGTAPRDPNERQAWENAHPGILEDSFHIPGISKVPVLKQLLAASGVHGDYVPARALEGAPRVLKFGGQMAELAPHLATTNMQAWTDNALSGMAIAGHMLTPDFLTKETGNFLNALSDPTKGSNIRWLAQKLTPVPGALKFVRGITDPERRDTSADPTKATPDLLQLMVNDIRNGIPYFSNHGVPGTNIPAMPPDRNMWTDTVNYTVLGTGGENVSPIAYTKAKDLTVENEVVRLGMTNPFYRDTNPEGDKYLKLSKPGKVVQMGGVTVELTPQQHDDYIMLAGGEYAPAARAKIMSESEAANLSKINLRDQLSQMIKDPSWSKLPDKFKKQEILSVVRSKREQAQALLFQMHPDMQLRQSLGVLDQIKASMPEGDPQRGYIDQQKSNLKNSFGGRIHP